jgi:Flp pilus assembly pilin Flp
MELLKKFWKEEDGQDLIEYGLLAGFIALSCVLALETIGVTLNGGYGTVNTELTDAFTPGT